MIGDVEVREAGGGTGQGEFIFRRRHAPAFIQREHRRRSARIGPDGHVG